jgi:hypothetical protein
MTLAGSAESFFLNVIGFQGKAAGVGRRQYQKVGFLLKVGRG